MGPTASGKTQLSYDLVKHFPCDIISVDSALIYRDMNIGTAKPTASELATIPHRLVNICDPSERYSVGQFREDAIREIQSIHEQGRLPLLVGGTMMYFHALINGIANLPTADAQIREQLTAEAERIGWNKMHERLQSVDPVSAAQIHPNDPQRIQRALEVYQITNKPMSVLQQESQNKIDFKPISIALSPLERSLLHQRIEQRFDLMLEQGLIDEVKALYQRGDLNPDMPSMRTVGYRQVWKYLEGEYDLATMRYKAIVATRQLAKRQLTWLRSWKDVHWFDTLDSDLLAKVAKVVTL